MQITLSEQLVRAIGMQKLAQYGVTDDNLRFNRFVQLELKIMTKKERAKLRSMIEAHKDIRGTGVALNDLDTWEKALSDAGQVKVRKLVHFEQLLIEFLLKLARVISTSRKAPIDLDMLEFALQFKPTVVKEEK